MPQEQLALRSIVSVLGEELVCALGCERDFLGKEFELIFEVFLNYVSNILRMAERARLQKGLKLRIFKVLRVHDREDRVRIVHLFVNKSPTFADPQSCGAALGDT